jgi:hypothetical protein
MTRICILASALALSLAACTGDQATRVQAEFDKTRPGLLVACNVDGVVVPVAQLLVASIGPGGTAAASTDAVLVHPAVVALCKAIKGTPASVTPTEVPVVTATAS